MAKLNEAARDKIPDDQVRVSPSSARSRWKTPATCATRPPGFNQVEGVTEAERQRGVEADRGRCEEVRRGIEEFQVEISPPGIFALRPEARNPGAQWKDPRRLLRSVL